MKNAWMMTIAGLVMVTALSACGKKSGGSSGGTAAVPPTNNIGTCVLNAQNQCVNGIYGQAAYISTAPILGMLALNSADSAAVQDFLLKMRLCQPGFNCAPVGNLRMQIRALSANGFGGNGFVYVYPGQSITYNIRLQTMTNNGWTTSPSPERRLTSRGYINQDGNGVQLVRPIITSQQVQCIQAPCYPVQSQNLLQFVGVFTDATKTTMNGTLYFNGRIVAQGPMYVNGFTTLGVGGQPFVQGRPGVGIGGSNWGAYITF